jgi:hypothetical protein
LNELKHRKLAHNQYKETLFPLHSEHYGNFSIPMTTPITFPPFAILRATFRKKERILVGRLSETKHGKFTPEYTVWGSPHATVEQAFEVVELLNTAASVSVAATTPGESHKKR